MEMRRAIEDRRSVRAFTDQPVDRAVLETILTLARCAPSGANLQPGRFHVLTGAPLKTLSDALLNGIAEERPQVSEYSYFPRPMPADLKARQRAAGFALYDALGIEKRDLEGRKAQFQHNYRFFGAPVGMIITIHREMGAGCFMDLGMAIQTMLLAVQDAGLAACGIGAMANYGDLIHDHLGLDANEMVVAGVAIGYAADHPVNDFRTERDALDVFATFRGFES